METTIELIKKLRQETNAAVMDCRQALELNNANYAAALIYLQEKAVALVGKHADRQTTQGTIEIYTHGSGRIGVMLEVNCETDFAARSNAFRSLVHEIVLQIAAAAPQWVDESDIPRDIIRDESEKAAARMRAEGKPETLIPRITAGHIKKFMDQQVLLRQTSIRDENRSIAQMLALTSASLGEKITIRRFVRWQLNDGAEE
jgi:elongation factor Ts